MSNPFTRFDFRIKSTRAVPILGAARVLFDDFINADAPQAEG